MFLMIEDTGNTCLASPCSAQTRLAQPGPAQPDHALRRLACGMSGFLIRPVVINVIRSCFRKKIQTCYLHCLEIESKGRALDARPAPSSPRPAQPAAAVRTSPVLAWRGFAPARRCGRVLGLDKLSSEIWVVRSLANPQKYIWESYSL